MPFTLSLGKTPPAFKLKGTDGKYYTLDDFKAAKALVIFFTCNHCPYVQGSDEITRKTAEIFRSQGAVFVAINPNSTKDYPEDSFEGMIERMEKYHFPWTYLHDNTQEIAKAYGALRTPHFFVFNSSRQLIYTGRGLDNPKDPSKSTVNNLHNTLEAYFAGKPIETPLTNPIGCNVKWNGKDSQWMPADACDIV